MGYRIEFGEIERALLSLNDVNNGCVFYDEKRKRIVCAYEGKSENIDDIFLTKQLAKSLPKYMVPTSYIRLNPIPISSTGKIDRILIQKNYEKNH